MNYYLCLLLLAVGCNGHASFREAEIERPCHVNDINCIRQYFADRSSCKKALGYMPERLEIDSTNAYFPRVNMSMAFKAAEIIGIRDGQVTEFYINRLNDYLVMTVEFKQIESSSRDTRVSYNLRGHQPIVTRGYSEIRLREVTVSGIFRGLNNLTLRADDIHVYSRDNNPFFVIDRSISTSPNPKFSHVIEAMYAAFISNTPVNVQEFLITQGPLYLVHYLRGIICTLELRASVITFPIAF